MRLLPLSSLGYIFDILLEDEYLATYFFTPENWEREFHGMADGSGISNKRIQFINLIPEAIRASCSIYGAWGPATSNGGLLHLRSLDWDQEAPLSQYPMISVYNFSTPGS